MRRYSWKLYQNNELRKKEEGAREVKMKQEGS